MWVFCVDLRVALTPPANWVRVRPDQLSQLVEFYSFSWEILLALLVFLFLVNRHEIGTNENPDWYGEFDMRSGHNSSVMESGRLSKPLCHWTLKHNTPLVVAPCSLTPFFTFFELFCPLELTDTLHWYCSLFWSLHTSLIPPSGSSFVPILAFLGINDLFLVSNKNSEAIRGEFGRWFYGRQNGEACCR